MKVSRNWIEDWVDLAQVDFLGVIERLSLSGLEVAGVNHVSDDHIVVGRILKILPHPNSEKLVVCTVDVGDGRSRQIGCGAKNMKEGDLVPVALPGAKPPGLDFEITARPLAGIESEGMLCAEEELGLESSSDGLWILSGDLELGVPVLKATRLEDFVVEIELTPNRPDALSHRGVAREIASIVSRKTRTTPKYLTESADCGTAPEVRVEDPDGCPRYLLASIDQVKVGPSPEWLRRRLALIGVRSINNIVDITNYVLMDLAQPLHAFDADKVQGAVVVRRAKIGEKLLGIDHKEHQLEEADLVIADDSGPIAIAGVMGGAPTEVSENTTRIYLECAYFDPTSVRKTARRLGLHTESSHRFERGIDAGNTEGHLLAAESLVMKVCESARILGRSEVSAHVPTPLELSLPGGLVEKTLGLVLEPERVSNLLESIGIRCSSNGEDFDVRVPTWRPDVERPIDLVEEVARLHGYEHLTPRRARTEMGHRHVLRPGKVPTIVPLERLKEERRIRETLLALGFAETLGYSFNESKAQTDIGPATAETTTLANPLSPELATMRTSLLPSLLKSLKTNLAQRAEHLAIFEHGRIYLADGERATLGMLMLGTKTEHFSTNSAWDFFDAKGVVEVLAAPLDVSGKWIVPPAEERHLHPGVQAHWIANKNLLARVGYLHPKIAQSMDIEGNVVTIEIDLDALLVHTKRISQYQAISKYPSVRRDFALLCPLQFEFAELEKHVRDTASAHPVFGDIFRSLRLFDVYEGEQVPEGMRSLAFSITYRSDHGTLTDATIQGADGVLIEQLKSHGLELR